MSETSGDRPSNLDFYELAVLNQGQVLEPLASEVPVRDLSPEVIEGLSRLPKSFVRDIIDGHTERPQTTELVVRYKEIKRVFAERAAKPVTPETETKHHKPRREYTPPKPLEEIIEDLIFKGQEEPQVDRLSLVVAKDPSNPVLIHKVDEAFRKKGQALDEPANAQLSGLAKEAIWKGYNRYLFTNNLQGDDQRQHKLLRRWISCLEEAPSDFGLGLQHKVIKKVISESDPAHALSPFIPLLSSGVDAISQAMSVLSDYEGGGVLYLPVIDALKAKLKTYPAEKVMAAVSLKVDATVEELTDEGELLGGKTYVSDNHPIDAGFDILTNLLRP